MRRAAVPVSEIAGSAGATPRSAKKQISQNPAIRTSAVSEASRSLNGASGFPENPSRNTPQIDLVAALQVSQNADKSKLACNPDLGCAQAKHSSRHRQQYFRQPGETDQRDSRDFTGPDDLTG